MVQVLESWGKDLGAGIGQGLSTAAQFGAQMKLKEKEKADRLKLIQEIEGSAPEQRGKQLQGQMPNPNEINQKFLESLPIFEQMKGSELTTQDADRIWKELFEPQLTQSKQQIGQQGAQQTASQESDPFAKAKRYAAAGEDQLARLETERAKSGIKERTEDKKLKQQRELAERKEAHGLALPTLERGRELLQDLPYKENALMAVKDSIQSGNLGMFSLDNLAELTGIEGLRSPEGAAFKTASKEFFLGNISRVGSKGLNQMMEKIVYEMGPQIGRSTEANLAVSEILGAENDVTRKEAELIHDIGTSYKEKHGHYPEDLSYRVDKELRPYAHQRQKDALEEVEKIKQRYAPKNKEGLLMYDPAGNLRRVPFGNKKEALKEGYRMP